uniref:NADP-malate dehydrogenase (Fragments) n=1 Tax=Pisum sativum TaxID=3888 RepID=Q9T2N5_PEA
SVAPNQVQVPAAQQVQVPAAQTQDPTKSWKK